MLEVSDDRENFHGPSMKVFSGAKPTTFQFTAKTPAL
jgi:hypothetical protein